MGTIEKFAKFHIIGPSMSLTLLDPVRPGDYFLLIPLNKRVKRLAEILTCKSNSQPNFDQPPNPEF